MEIDINHVETEIFNILPERELEWGECLDDIHTENSKLARMIVNIVIGNIERVNGVKFDNIGIVHTQ